MVLAWLYVIFLCIKHIFSNGTEHCDGKICIPSNYSRLNAPLINTTNEIFVKLENLKILKGKQILTENSVSRNLMSFWKSNCIKHIFINLI